MKSRFNKIYLILCFAICLITAIPFAEATAQNALMDRAKAGKALEKKKQESKSKQVTTIKKQTQSSGENTLRKKAENAKSQGKVRTKKLKEYSEEAETIKAVQEQVVVKETEPVEKPKEEEIYIAVEQPAEFPGGTAALMKWLSQNISYPQAAQMNGIQGRVMVKLVVEKDGSIGNVTILKGVDRDFDREAIRVVKKMPKWTPARNNGVPVASYFNLPIMFKTQNQ